MSTAIELITLALKDAGVIGEGQTASSDTVNDSLTTLTDMLSHWEITGNVIFGEQILQIPCTNSTSYTIGITGNYNTDKVPYKINFAQYDIDDVKYPLRFITYAQYNNDTYIFDTGYPTLYSYNLSYPNSTAYINSKPSSGFLELGVTAPLSTLLTLTSDIQIPSQYNQAIRFNLAAILATTFGVPIRADIVALAATSLNSIKRINNKINKLFSNHPYRNKNFNVLNGD